MEVLGFTEKFRFGDYAGVGFGEVQLHLCARSENGRVVGAGGVYLFCDAVDAYFVDLEARGALIGSRPRDYAYGMRDFWVKDPDGNQLSFGCTVCPQAA